jgi:hypothetical protein
LARKPVADREYLGRIETASERLEFSALLDHQAVSERLRGVNKFEIDPETALINALIEVPTRRSRFGNRPSALSRTTKPATSV